MSHNFVMYFAGRLKDFLKYTIGTCERHKPGHQKTNHKYFLNELYFNIITMNSQKLPGSFFKCKSKCSGTD